MTRDIVFRVASASPYLASTRYRAMMPALGLEGLGYRCAVTARPLSDDTLRATACIIFAKAFRDADVETAQRAHALGVPIVLDICDHMFFPEYGGGKGAAYADAFRTMAAMARAVVTTGSALADVVRDLAPAARIEIIPDQVETPGLLARILVRAKQWTPPTWRERMSALLHGAGRAATTPPSRTPTNLPTLIWFGNHGAGHSAFGMDALAPHLPLLTQLNAKAELRLLVVSNSREKFDRLFAQASFAAEYREWAAERIFADLDEAQICLMPMPREPFTACKSANRAVLALSRGAAVVADDFPALADLRDSIAVDDWAGGLSRYLADDGLRQAHVASAREIIGRLYSAETVANQWAGLIEAVRSK